VDNPHTKPIPFWRWMIRSVQDVHPEAVFLAEAFTRPKMMRELAKVGFSQSYTYFTWRNFKDELEEYMIELTRSESAEYMRGNLWPNTPDILPEILQRGGPPAFKLRLALAATLSSSYGIYSGYEVCEGRPLKGEEYLDSEKYQLVAWDPKREGNIVPFVTALNRIRKENPALRLYKNLEFYAADNERVLFYGKATPDGKNQVLVAVSLDPYEAQEATLEIPLEALGISETEPYEVEELLQKKRLFWTGPTATVKLTPDAPCAIWSVRRFTRKEASFDYFH
jgi:starch synthase (maltosyl-transferring)